jgi:hypothetical protein
MSTELARLWQRDETPKGRFHGKGTTRWRAQLAMACIWLVVLPGMTFGQKPLPPAEESIIKVLKVGSVSGDLSLIPFEQRDAVIARLRETAQLKKGYSLLGTTLLDPMDADLLLLRLGDTFTIERMMKDYRKYDSMVSWGYVARSFRYARQPKLIPYLIEDVNVNEDPNKGITVKPPPNSGDFAVGVPARCIFSGVIVTDIIKSSPLFTVQMKAWASQAFAIRLESPERFQSLMRIWWEANKAAFAREDYQGVLPLADQEAAPPPHPASTPRQRVPAATTTTAVPSSTMPTVRPPASEETSRKPARP